MSRTRLEFYETPVDEIQKGDVIVINDPTLGFGPGGRVMETANVFQTVSYVLPHTPNKTKIGTTDAHLHIVLNNTSLITVQKTLM